MRTMYMHTIDDHPATFESWEPKGEGQIVFADIARHRGQRVRTHVTLRGSLREIRRDQRASVAFRESRKLTSNDFRYGYVLVEVPA